MKKITIILICLLLSMNSFEQVFEAFNNYTNNRFIFNPAATGDYGIFVYTDLRYKWLGMENAPRTQEAGFYNIISTRQGVGAKITNISSGLLRQTSVSASYSFKTETSRDRYLFMGLWVRGVQRDLDIVDAYVFQSGDPTLDGDYYKKIYLTFGTGLTYKSKWYRFDLSMPSLLNDEAEFQKNVIAMAEYTFVLRPGSAVLMPSVFVLHSDPNSNYIDVNLNSLFFNLATLQVSYRTNQSLFVMVGYYSLYSIYLSYEFTIGNIATFNHGTFEATLSYAFGRKASQKTRIRLPWNWTY